MSLPATAWRAAERNRRRRVPRRHEGRLPRHSQQGKRPGGGHDRYREHRQDVRSVLEVQPGHLACQSHNQTATDGSCACGRHRRGARPVLPPVEGNGPDMLLGRPIHFTEHCAAIGDLGDLVLASGPNTSRGCISPCSRPKVSTCGLLPTSALSSSGCATTVKPW